MLKNACVRVGNPSELWVRDRWETILRAAMPISQPRKHLPLHIADGRLLGGLDLLELRLPWRLIAAFELFFLGCEAPGERGGLRRLRLRADSPDERRW